MPRYRSKPVEIEATQWFPDRKVDGVIMEPVKDMPGKCRYYVVTMHRQKVYLDAGDWIITEPDGIHHYPCKPQVFDMKYEPVVPVASPPALVRE